MLGHQVNQTSFTPIWLAERKSTSPHTTLLEHKTTTTSATASQPPLSVKTRLTSVLRLCPTSKETPPLQGLLNVEKMTKLFSSTWQSAVQVKWITAAASTQRFESLRSRCIHLLGSLSPFTFKLARFRAILNHFPIQCLHRSRNPWGWGCWWPVSGSQCWAQWSLDPPWTDPLTSKENFTFRALYKDGCT